MIENGCGGGAATVLAACAALPPGPDVLVALGDVDPGVLSEADRITMVQLYERSEAAVTAAKQRVLAALAAGAAVDPMEWVREDLACALTVAPGTAHDRLRVAATLSTRARATLARLAAGRLPFTHAGLLARTLADLADERAAAVEARVLATAEGRTFGRFRRSVERAVIATDPRTAAERRQDAVRARRVWIRAVEDGMAVLGAVVPKDQASIAWQALTARAKAAVAAGSVADGSVAARPAGPVTAGPVGAGRCADPGCLDDRCPVHGATGSGPRTLDQCRADLFAELLTGRTGAGPAGGACGTSVETRVEILVPVDTLLGVSGEPGELKGLGLLDPAYARALAFATGASWTRLVVGYDGELLSHDRGYRADDPGALLALLTRPPSPPPGPVDRYRPSVAQERFVRARDRACVFPVCARDADACETDHTLSRAVGGETDLLNLRPLCKRHHQAKTRGRWHLQSDGHGGLVWTSRHRRRYHLAPTDLHDL